MPNDRTEPSRNYRNASKRFRPSRGTGTTWLHPLVALLLSCGAAAADEPSDAWGVSGEAVVLHGNDHPFGSDGAGPSGIVAGAVRYGEWFAGAALVGVTPELRMAGDFRAHDPLREMGRLAGWVGRLGAFPVPLGGLDLPSSRIETSLSLRAGAEGGAIDDLAEDTRDLVHEMFGVGVRDLHSANETKPLFGLSGYASLALPLRELGPITTTFAPFTYGAFGTDVVEGAVGAMLALQSLNEDRLPYHPLSDTAAHAPMFGGDGLALFTTARAVAHDSLYGGLEEPLVLEAGASGQVTLFDRFRVGADVACETALYAGAPKGSCMANVRFGTTF